MGIPQGQTPPVNDESRIIGEIAEQLRRERELSGMIIDNSADMIASFDRDLRLRVWNAQAERLTGILRQHAWGMDAVRIPPLVKRRSSN